MIFVALALLLPAWPAVAVGAGVLIALAGTALTNDRLMRDRPRALARAGWLLTAGFALTALAGYGYGLEATTFGAFTDADDRCAVARGDDYGPGPRGPADGSLSMWPLHDTSCGPDLVPGFVNPLVAVSTTLFVTLAVITTVARIRSRASRRRGCSDRAGSDGR